MIRVKIDGINSQNKYSGVKEVKVEEPLKKTDKEAIKEQPAAVYEKSEPAKSGHVYDKSTILKLKRESEQAHQSLIRIVEDMLRRQGKTLKLLSDDDIVEVDEIARAEANDLISENGPLGVEAVSQRLVDFAIGISGGDKSKADTLRAAIEKGFKEAERILGELPDISKETYKRTMEKFDEWAKS